MRVPFFLLFSFTTLFAQFDREPITLKMVNSKIKIIDIRTPDEWEETGIVKGSIPIMFFDEKRNYDLDAFVKKLNKVVKKDEQFVVICRSGARGRVVGNLLGNQLDYNVIAIKGGIQEAISKNIPMENYK